MAKMGWEEGQTLGSKGSTNGLAKCLQPDLENLSAEKRAKGIGANKSIHSSNWWENAFNDAASELSVGKKKDRKRKNKSASSSSPEKKSKKSKNRDGTATSASADELRIIENLTKDKWGFTGGREGKMERIRRQEEEYLKKLRADEGMKSDGEKTKTKSSGRADAESKKSHKSSKKKKTSSKGGKDAKESEEDLVYTKELEQCKIKSKLYGKETWWGSKLFFFSGILGSHKRKKDATDSSTNGVSEKDQVKAFFKAKENAVYDHSGIGSQFLDIKLGEEFQGKKKTFETLETNKEEDSDSDKSDTIKIKWKKAFKKALDATTAPMHINDLKSKVIGKHLEALDTDKERNQLEAKFMKKLAKCKHAKQKKSMIHYKQ